MLLSMTGFASTTANIPLENGGSASITVNIKSLNSRFFESTFKLPYALSFLETELIQLCKKTLKRGHVFFNITMSNPNLFKATVEPSTSVVQGYVDAISSLQKSFNISGELTIAELIQLPNAFYMEEKGVSEQTKKIILETAETVLALLTDVRKQEGERLADDIKQRCAILNTTIEEIEKISAKVMEERAAAINEQLKALEQESGERAESQRNTLYNDLNKLSIHEEIIRFKSHLKNLEQFIDSNEIEKGKRIDFTLQELSRETNTIAAKCANVTISSLAITSKVELEKIKEQNQNVV
jgi:uncharacterized protein (TIGR00255 family)